ncbi:MAG: acyl-CoA thioesterase [Pseudomonadota bacterium]
MTPTKPPDMQPVIRTIAMPGDTNPAGDIFGGWLLSQMDLAAGNLAAQVAKGRSATVAIESMQFLKPVKVGDEVSLYAQMLRLGRTSMRIRVSAWRRSRYSDFTEQVTQGVFSFVALTPDGRPREFDKPLPETRY